MKVKGVFKKKIDSVDIEKPYRFEMTLRLLLYCL